MKPAPCENCLIIPICRQQYFIDMKNRCRLVEKYLFQASHYAVGRNDFDHRVNRVHDAINPVYWKRRESLSTYYTQEFPIEAQGSSCVRFRKKVI